jgi:hypothetical protein
MEKFSSSSEQSTMSRRDILRVTNTSRADQVKPSKDNKNALQGH